MVNFLSRVVMSFSGFVATIVLTRTLGQDRYGTYVVVLSVLAWTAMMAQFGIPMAIKKRISETTDGNYVLSGLAVQFGMYSVLAVCLWLARPFLNEFMGIQATWVLIAMLGVRVGLTLVQSILDGQHLVHLSSVLVPVEWTFRSVIQVVFVLSGAGIAGAFAGYVAGALVAIVLGSYFISVPRYLPSKREFQKLKSYAQFSWLGSITNRMFQSMDTMILAVFVSHSLIAVYEVAWNLASLFAIFGGSISQTLFPEMSEISSSEESKSEISDLLRVSLAYSGLFIIPGLVGAALVGDVVLTIYGSGFETGYYILLILTFARLIYGYSRQFLSTIDALDRPKLTFYVNTVFVATNLCLNIILTWKYGWHGAAVATTVSSTVSLFGGYYFANQIVDITLPVSEIGKQCLAAGIMAVSVLGGRIVFGDSIPVVVLLVGIGAAVYFIVLLAISQEFRQTVEDNLPVSLPLLSTE
ncbi:polysaccharide biosynthesis C-terminal domain-containing protein [Halorubrum saccharovorum]|nr:polysaccharide biosynthesis C-terminal domain-containing protein [Halorubrum saccharovorum]